MTNIFKTFILLLILSTSIYAVETIIPKPSVEANVEENPKKSGVKVSETDGKRAIAQKIAGSKDGMVDFKSTIKKLRDIRAEIVKSSKNSSNTTGQKVCTAKSQMLTYFGDLGTSIAPFINFIASILVLLAIKKLFIDNPESQPNGISTNIYKGATFILIALILMQFDTAMDWWRNDMVPKFDGLCRKGNDSALSIVILEQMLYLIFVFVQFIGALTIILGINDMIKKDRSGKFNAYGVGTKIIGGIMLVNFKYIFAFMGIIQITSE